MGCGSTNEKLGKSNDFSYCFKESEISLINELKKKKDEEGVDADSFSTIYAKVETDLTKKEQIFKEYRVLYIPSNYNKESITYDYNLFLNYIDFEPKEDTKIPKYSKKNNNSRDIVKFEIKMVNDEYNTYYKPNLEFKVNQEDKEKNLITIELCYNIKLIQCYGVYGLYFDFGDEVRESNSCSLFINDEYTIEERHDEKKLTKISNTEYYSTNNEIISLILRNKNLKIKIENEVDKKLLSKFSSDEIKQINFSLDKIKIYPRKKILLYHKIIHNIKDDKDNMKMYYFIFYPHIIGTRASAGAEADDGGEDEGQISYPIIINECKINDMLVKKYKNIDEIPENERKISYKYKYNSNLNDEKVHGYYVSTLNELELNYAYKGTFGVYEFVCESTGVRDYFDLNYLYLLNFNLDIGSSFKYEIILNGNKIKFSNPDFQYKIINDKIIFDGYLDEYDEQKYIALKKKKDPDFDINEDSENYRHWNWKSDREDELIPNSMEIV